MSRARTSLDHKRIQRLIWLVFTVFVLLGYSLHSVTGSVSYPMVMEAYGTISSPPVILKEGNYSGTTTIYTNSTSAKVNVTAPLFDYVDNDNSDVDSSPDEGTHSNFTAEQYGPDSIYDTLIEGDYGPVVVNNTENFVDNNSSNVDAHVGHGTSSNFTAQQDANVAYNDTLTEADTGSPNVTSSFGWSTASTTGTNTIEGTICGSNYTATGNGYVLNITAYITITTSAKLGRAALYFASNHTKIAETSEVTLAVAAASWRTFTFTSQPQIYSGTEYLLVTWSASGSGTGLLSYATGTTTQGHVYTAAYNSTNFPTTLSNPTHNTNKFDIYVNYTTVTTNYELDYEFQWTTADSAQANEYLCIRTSTFTGTAENIGVDVWTGTPAAWVSISNALTTNTWNNISISNYLNQSTITFRLVGKTETSDSAQNTWQIECSLLHTWSTQSNYQLDLEVQWTNAGYTRTNEELCIKTGTLGAENLRVDVWNGSTWITVISALLPNVWNNVSVTSYLTSATFTTRYKGGNETNDTVQDSWQIDAALLHVWTESTYDYVLQVVNQVADNWTINLRVYDTSNIVPRLLKTTMSFHDGTSSDQIIVNDGSVTQTGGPPYSLTGNATIYISMSNLQATATGTSYLYTYLTIQVPSKSTYTIHIITFEIT